MLTTTWVHSSGFISLQIFFKITCTEQAPIDKQGSTADYQANKPHRLLLKAPKNAFYISNMHSTNPISAATILGSLSQRHNHSLHNTLSDGCSFSTVAIVTFVLTFIFAFIVATLLVAGRIICLIVPQVSVLHSSRRNGYPNPHLNNIFTYSMSF